MDVGEEEVAEAVAGFVHIVGEDGTTFECLCVSEDAVVDPPRQLDLIGAADGGGDSVDEGPGWHAGSEHGELGKAFAFCFGEGGDPWGGLDAEFLDVAEVFERGELKFRSFALVLENVGVTAGGLGSDVAGGQDMDC